MSAHQLCHCNAATITNIAVIHVGDDIMADVSFQTLPAIV